MNKYTRIMLGISIVSSVYMAYLFFAWFVFKSFGTNTFYVVPFFLFGQPGNSLLELINLIAFIALASWTSWLVLFIKGSK